MADTPDPQELARRYLDLWQQHLTQAATDPDIAAAMAKFWQNMPAGAASGIPGWPPMPANTGVSHNDTAREESATGSPANPASSDGSGDDIDELRDRMAALEKRLVALEPKPRSSRKRAAKGSGKRKS